MYNYCTNVFNRLSSKVLFLLLPFVLLLCITAKSQSYYYFECNLQTADSLPLNYFIFLTVDVNSTASARILFKDAYTGNKKMVKQNYIDSVYGGMDSSSNIRYLLPVGIAYNTDNTEDTGFIQPRFVFEKQVTDSNLFFAPTAIEYAAANGRWQQATTTLNQQKTYTELSAQQNFVKLFFSPAESFYKYLFNIDKRGLNNIEKKTCLFLIAVANTNDASIGVTSQKDLDKITGIFTGMAEGLGIQFHLKKISGSSFSKKAVDDAINNWLKPGPADIVVFYYSGHGFRYTTDLSKYPRISLRTSTLQNLDLNNLMLETIYNRIVAKGARVNIVLSDCCNDDIGLPQPVGRLPLVTRSASENTNLNIDNCKALFFPNHTVNVLVNSAEKGQLATGNPTLGGFFTNFLQAQLSKSLYGNQGETSWLRLLLNAKESARWQALSALCDDKRCVQRAEIAVIPPQ